MPELRATDYKLVVSATSAEWRVQFEESTTPVTFESSRPAEWTCDKDGAWMRTSSVHEKGLSGYAVGNFDRKRSDLREGLTSSTSTVGEIWTTPRRWITWVQS